MNSRSKPAKSEERRAESPEDRIIIVCGLLLAIACALMMLAGCAGTVTPRVVRDAVASFDGTNQNSGFIRYLPDGSGLITGHAFHRYQDLVHEFGGRFSPPIVYSTDGVTPTGTNAFIIDQQHLEYFATMNRWRKQAATH